MVERQFVKLLVACSSQALPFSFLKGFDMIKEFRGEYRFLSNFAPCEITYEGITYPTTEHAYQAAKTPDKEEKLRISKLSTPGQAKRAGGKLSLPTNWFEISTYIMKDILYIKFSMEPFKTQLLATGTEFLAEGNTWGDLFWGVDLATGEGQNVLGFLLMELRDMIGQRNEK